MKWQKHIPNFLTLVNLLLGCLALVYLFYDHLLVEIAPAEFYYDGRIRISSLYLGKMHIAALLIFIAAVVDFLDGFAARALDARSAIGGQLDSLADLVTFGLVPGMIAYYLLAISFIGSSIALELSIWTFVPGFLLTLCGAYRLAKFNVRHSGQNVFYGLPIPVMALFIAAIPLILRLEESTLAGEIFLNSYWLYGIVLALSFLMVSKVRMFNLKFAGDGMNNLRYGFLAGIVMALAIGYFVFEVLFLMVPLIIIMYIIISIILNFKTDAVQGGDQRDATQGTAGPAG